MTRATAAASAPPAGVMPPARAWLGQTLRNAATRLRAAGIATARQDAELLLARALGTTRLGLYVDSWGPEEAGPSVETLARFDGDIARRAGQEPLQYLLGAADFCGLSLAVGSGVFIPRPETEGLVARARAILPAAGGVLIEPCAGSGAVACALAVGYPGLSVWATELAPAAVPWALENVHRLGLADRVTVLEGDLFGPLAARGLEGRCDLVVANPPYIARPALATLPDEVGRWEPALALDGGPDGTAVIVRIVAEAPAFLRPGGTLLLEVGHDQGERLRARLAEARAYGPAVVHRDGHGRERILEARRRA